MLAKLAVAAAVAAIAQPGSASAHWAGAELGASFVEVRAAYPEARELRRDAGGARALELPPLTYSGVRWSRATLVFDAAERLDHVTFETMGPDFDVVKARVDAELRLEMAAQAFGSVLARSGFVGATQMRICQDADGRIDVTFEDRKYDS